MDKETNNDMTWPKGHKPKDGSTENLAIRFGLISNILKEKPVKKINTEIFNVMATRRSTRKFSKNPVEMWKIDKILAAADTAPTAGNYQGFEIFYIRDGAKKISLVKAANNQPYVNTPVVLVFCMNPDRIKLDFPKEVISKFSIQDSTLAAAYSQLAAAALGLSSIWIGMFDENKVKEIIGTDLRPCLLYTSPSPRDGLLSRMPSSA